MLGRNGRGVPSGDPRREPRSCAIRQAPFCRGTSTESAPPALGVLERWNSDIVLMDVQMPEMDRTETVQRIRQRVCGSSRHQPTIAVTAQNSARDRGRASGARRIFSSPGPSTIRTS
ncbi:MAG: response regulator [Bryobacteraceae bacterium]